MWNVFVGVAVVGVDAYKLMKAPTKERVRCFSDPLCPQDDNAHLDLSLDSIFTMLAAVFIPMNCMGYYAISRRLARLLNVSACP